MFHRGLTGQSFGSHLLCLQVLVVGFFVTLPSNQELGQSSCGHGSQWRNCSGHSLTYCVSINNSWREMEENIFLAMWNVCPSHASLRNLLEGTKLLWVEIFHWTSRVIKWAERTRNQEAFVLFPTWTRGCGVCSGTTWCSAFSVICYSIISMSILLKTYITKHEGRVKILFDSHYISSSRDCAQSIAVISTNWCLC